MKSYFTRFDHLGPPAGTGYKRSSRMQEAFKSGERRLQKSEPPENESDKLLDKGRELLQLERQQQADLTEAPWEGMHNIDGEVW